MLAICDRVSEGRLELPPKARASKLEADDGFVYLLKSGRHYKIGRSISVGQRERQLAIQLPEKAGVIHQIRTDDPVGIEAYWHKRFEAKRKNGEWFELTSADINVFKRRKFM
ncbi:MAG: GIY-YIG nuclease family protein [Rhizomicrobium sp.]